jgi:hypothetical protein
MVAAEPILESRGVDGKAMRCRIMQPSAQIGPAFTLNRDHDQVFFTRHSAHRVNSESHERAWAACPGWNNGRARRFIGKSSNMRRALLNGQREHALATAHANTGNAGPDDECDIKAASDQMSNLNIEQVKWHDTNSGRCTMPVMNGGLVGLLSR